MDKAIEIFFRHLFGVAEHFGIIGNLTVLIIAFALISFLFEKPREAFITFVYSIHNIFFRKNALYIKRASLFLNEKLYVERVNDIKFDDDNKTYLFTSMMLIQINIIVFNGRRLVNEFSKYEKLSKEEFISLLKIMVVEMINEYEKEILAKFSFDFGQEKGKRLYDCVYLGNDGRKKGFKQYTEDNIRYLNKILQNDLEMPIRDKKYIAFNFLSMLNANLSLSIGDLYKTFVTFNGDLIKIIEDD